MPDELNNLSNYLAKKKGDGYIDLIQITGSTSKTPGKKWNTSMTRINDWVIS